MKMIPIKKVFAFCLFSIGLSICSCTNDADVFPANDEFPVCLSKTRSLQKAIDIAKKARALVVNNQTRSNSQTIDVEDVICIESASTRSASGADTLLYVVNYKGDNGFAVISANPNTEEDLLAIVEKGHFEEGQHTDTGFDLFLKNAKQYVESAPMTRSVNAHEEGKIEMDTFITRYFPKLDVEWGQTGCEGLYAPNGKAGCSNVAMAQIMSYYQHPSSIRLSYNGGSSSITLDWSTMTQFDTLHPHDDGICNYQIASLLRQLGHLNNSDYTDPLGTSTDPTTVRNKFRNTFSYSVSSFKNYAREDFSTAFASDKLIFMHGDDCVSSNNMFSHDWVVDGNLILRITTTMWRKLVSEDEWHLEDQNTTQQKYIHINWGWYGCFNGYFSTNVLTTNRGYTNDNPNISSSDIHTFNSGLSYFEVKH